MLEGAAEVSGARRTARRKIAKLSGSGAEVWWRDAGDC